LTPLAAMGAAVATFVIWAHRENIGRLRRGEERRIGAPKVAEGAS
jgi:glycerol-3-phosphate acyltransferase PlsY